jgi:superfamily II DNA helicase RecQ
MPSSLEQYYLEAALAGRDGETAQCVLLHSAQDKAAHATAIERAHPDRAAIIEVLGAVGERRPFEEVVAMGAPERGRAALAVLEDQGFVRWVGESAVEATSDTPDLKRLDTMDVDRRRRQAEERLRVMDRYAEARGCRRMEMLAYFGERLATGWQCAGCDRCRLARESASPDAGVWRQAVVMGVRELEGRRFSINEMARAILFLAPPHVTRPLKGKSEAEVRDLINALLREGAIELESRGQYVRSKR